VGKFIGNANSLKTSIEEIINSFRKQNALLLEKRNKEVKDSKGKEITGSPVETTDGRQQNSGIIHLEKILSIRKEIAATGQVTEAQTASEMRYMEYLARYMTTLKSKSDTGALDEIKEKFKEIEATGVTLPELLKAIVTTPTGANDFITILDKAKNKVKELNAEAGKSTSKAKKGSSSKAAPELKKETAAEMADRNADAAVDYIRSLRDILNEMSSVDYGSTQWVRLKNEAKEYEGYIRSVYNTIL